MTPNIEHLFPLAPEAFAALGGPGLVYVRAVKAADLGALVMADDYDGEDLTPDHTLYAVHRADGARLAVLTDRDAAYAAAVAHNLAPVSVH